MEMLALLVFGSLALGFALFDHDPQDDDPDPRDTLSGDDGPDAISGDDDPEDLLGLGGNDTLDGGGGDDRLEGGDGIDLLIGGDGNDSIFGGADLGSMDGGDGNDLLDGSEGSGQMDGGAGDDTLILSDLSTVIGNGGDDRFVLDVDEMAGFPTFADFTPGEDTLEIHYTPQPGTEPEVTLNPDPSVDGANSWLEMNGVIIGYVLGEFGLGPGDIVLVPKVAA